jgi:hypothetical protein
MGYNIAETLLAEMTFQSDSIEILLESVYSSLFSSKIDIKIHDRKVIVEDKKCPLCKYSRKDISIAPCTVITSMLTLISKNYGFSIEQFKVHNSVALGDKTCIHIYELQEERK